MPVPDYYDDWSTNYSNTTPASTQLRMWNSTTTAATSSNVMYTGLDLVNYKVRLNATYYAWRPITLRSGWFTTTSGNTSFTPRVQTAEELAKAAAKLKRVTARARRLLREHLDDRELDQLAAKNYFEVVSSSGRRYRIYRGHSRNVVELDEKGLAVARLCAHPSESLPDEDHMLAQRLWLQTAEDEFRRIANISRIGTVEAAQLVA